MEHPDQQCIVCSKQDRRNQHRLDPLSCPITYSSNKIITSLRLPRKYTTTHNDDRSEIYVSIGSDYNQNLLNTDEVINLQTQVIGKWIQRKHRYEIHLNVQVSTLKNPDAYLRNTIFCKELGLVLEGIALAETGLLHTHPKLAKTRIYIHFKSIEEKYRRIERWGRLGDWQ
jgi:hypothetical protein